MPPASGTSVRLQIGHVLFMDLVGYSTLLLDEQRQYLEQLTEIVRGTEQVRSAKEAGKLIRLPVGDGMALVFFDSPESPVRCAIEISKKLKEYPQLKLRMGIHSGPINEVRDVNDSANVAGAGINLAQRIYARLGENDLAIPLIERLLKTSGPVDSANYSVTVNDLKYRWEWDPIRDDPRFKQLVTEISP
jgi:hypothetical protein